MAKDEGTTNQATIQLSRLSGIRQNARARYKVRIDGNPVGKIAAGDVQRYDVPPGPHTIQVRIDWVGSPVIGFEAAPGETIPFECAPRGGSLALLVLLKSIVRPSDYLELWPSQDKRSQ